MNPLPSSPQALPVVRAAELKQTRAATRWLIDSLWAEGGVGLIGGTPKSLKSWLGLEMAVSVATGTPCLGRFQVQSPGPALVYLAEDAPTVVRERLLALCQVRDVALDDLDVRVITAPSLRIDLLTEQQKLKETIALHRPRLLVLDPFVRLHRIDENQAQEVAPLLDFLRTLNRTYEIAIVLVHHTRKSGSGSQSGQALRGSSDFHAWGDSNAYLTHDRGSLKLTLEHRAAPAPEPFHVRLETNPLHLALADAPDEQPLSVADRVMAVVDRAQAPLTRTELRRQVKVNNHQLGLALSGLENLGQLSRSPDGWAR